MYRLIVSDMDGTLLDPVGKVSEKTKQTFKRLLDNDIHVAIATGRIYTSAKVYAKHLDIVTPIIACNGAIVKDLHNNDIIYESHIAPETCFKVFDICRENDLYFHFYTEDTFYTEKLAYSSIKYNEWNKTMDEDEQIDMQIIEDPYELVSSGNEKIYKIQINTDDMTLLNDVRNILETLEGVEISKSWHNNIEIMNKGVSKGNAVKHLAESMGISREEIICFGDNENDISMLTYAGMGVAMGNAEDGVKKWADYITLGNDEDGVARAIEKFVFV